jgi:NAD(P)-dependent dehydrogenase (short-subunit alcohol dehydrogenase family)
MSDFTGRVVMITGASGNLGNATGRAFLEAGAKLALVDRHEEQLLKTFPELINEPDCFMSGCADLTLQKEVDQVVTAAIGYFNQIDILVNTVGGYPGLKGVANASAYSASKSAVIRLVESASAEVKKQGININCILPGTIDTPQNREAMPYAEFSRWVTPKSIADVIMFLASDAGRDIHGAAIPVYGLS